jgi:uncharacterized repeat protein (TIGR03803 family)
MHPSGMSGTWLESVPYDYAKHILKIFLLLALITALTVIGPHELGAQTATVLHAFIPLSGSLSTNSDGANPAGGFVLSTGLYGTASHGGASGAGTIFVINTNGAGFTNLHSFEPLAGLLSTNGDGAYPVAGLVLSGNTLYGTASFGGDSGAGTVFKMNADGTGFTNLHSFAALSGVLFSNSDGAHPQAGLLLSGSALYGTARDGGASGNGTVFAINSDGTGFTNLHSFSAAYYNPFTGYYTNLDGANPVAGLLLSSNRLYGTVVYGGKAGQGAVFALETNGAGFVTLHNFTLVSRNSLGNYINGDGANPAAPLVLSGNILYGTAQNGGGQGFGTAFSLPTDGSAFTPLHSFVTLTDGANPVAPFVLAGSTLYGTATAGGSSGSGTLFTLNTNGTAFTNLYNFTTLVSATNNVGANPVAGLALSGNTLYGAAYSGSPSGAGSLFSLSLRVNPPRLAIELMNTNVTLAWPADGLGFTLQSTTNLSPPVVWTNSFPPAVVVNGQNVVTNSISEAVRFYRLMR